MISRAVKVKKWLNAQGKFILTGGKGCFLSQSDDVLTKLYEVKVKQLIEWRLQDEAQLHG